MTKTTEMTKDEILNMPAGREKDVLIAEKFFGWTWRTFKEYSNWVIIIPPDFDGDMFSYKGPPEYSLDAELLNSLRDAEPLD